MKAPMSRGFSYAIGWKPSRRKVTNSTYRIKDYLARIWWILFASAGWFPQFRWTKGVMHLRQVSSRTGIFIDHLASHEVFLPIRSELVSRRQDRGVEETSQYSALDLPPEDYELNYSEADPEGEYSDLASDTEADMKALDAWLRRN